MERRHAALVGFVGEVARRAGFLVGRTDFKRDARLLPDGVDEHAENDHGEGRHDDDAERSLNLAVDEVDGHHGREGRPVDDEENGEEDENQDDSQRSQFHGATPCRFDRKRPQVNEWRSERP